jgi:alkanesulfonate monooxygenase SsuD/methylene tetrahydromethanopterin reductase-like flavin-dependent oxidoreductase (luciferase family)
MAAIRIGVSLRSGYGNVDARQGARWMIERAAAARDAGLDSLFVGDHHGVPAPYYQNVPVLGRLLAEWDDRPAGALFLLPLWNPVLVAEQIGTLAAIARGRFIVQCSIGGGDAQFAAMGADLHTRPSRFEHALDVVRRLCAGETVDGTRIAPVPPEPLEVWIGGAAPKAIDRAARLGDGFLAGPEATPAHARALIEQYRERCDAHARTPSAIAIRRDVHVAATHDDAARVAEPIIDAGYRGFAREALVYGAPDEVAHHFDELATMGYTDVIVRHLADDHDAVLRSFAQFPAVRARLRVP